MKIKLTFLLGLFAFATAAVAGPDADVLQLRRQIANESRANVVVATNPATTYVPSHTGKGSVVASNRKGGTTNIALFKSNAKSCDTCCAKH